MGRSKINCNQKQKNNGKQMNTTMMTGKPAGSRRWKLATGLIALALLAGGLTACRTTKQVSETEKDFSGFLGDYSKLKKGEGNEANFIYVDRSADWAKYTKIYIKPVELWKSEDKDSRFGKMSHDEQEELISLFHTAMANALENDFQLVDQPGPDTLVAHAALTEAGKSWPVLNLVSTVYPAALVLSYVKQGFTGTGSFVGKVRIEAEMTDGVTGQRVAAIVDERAGTKALRTKFDGNWGDVKLCFDWWAKRFSERLELFKQGEFTAQEL
jgi:hypothetical protein